MASAAVPKGVTVPAVLEPMVEGLGDLRSQAGGDDAGKTRRRRLMVRSLRWPVTDVDWVLKPVSIFISSLRRSARGRQPSASG